MEKTKIEDMPKIESPFVRKQIDGKYVVTNEISEGYEWVFKDDKVLATEKLHGTNVSILIQDGTITSIWNRTERLPFFNKGKKFIIDGLLNSYEKGYMEFLPDGQSFGELIGPKVNGNPYKLDQHIWVPFETYAKKHLSYKSWGKYPKTFESISEWFKDLMPLFTMKHGDKEGFVEGVVFVHEETGQMAKLRKDTFDWYYKENPNAKQHKGGSHQKMEKISKENDKWKKFWNKFEMLFILLLTGSLVLILMWIVSKG